MTYIYVSTHLTTSKGAEQAIPCVQKIQPERIRMTEMAEIDKTDSSQILGLGKTPAQWVEIMAEREIEISERTLRERANDTGAFYRLGRTMLITPAQIDTIFEGGQACRSQSKRGGASTTSTARSTTTGGRSPVHTEKALTRLQEQAQRTG
jgi:hypothetical protein